jgi:transposase-like protein
MLRALHAACDRTTCGRRPLRRETSHWSDLGFKWFRTAAITIAGIELLRRIHKGLFDFPRLRLKDRSNAVWTAAPEA